MKSVNKLMAVMGLAEELSAKGVAGDIVEAGVAGGGGVMPLVFYLACTGDLANRTVYLFDTWKGLPPATDPHDDGFRKGEFNLKWNVFMLPEGSTTPSSTTSACLPIPSRPR